MKKNDKKSVVLFEMRNQLYHVILRLREDGDFRRFITCSQFVVEVRNLENNSVNGFGFSISDDALSFIYENYAWIFIPYSRWKTEGHHLSVY